MDLPRARWGSSSRVTFPISLRSHSIIPQGSECTTLRRECSATFMRTGFMAHVWIGQIGFARTHCFHPFFQHHQQALYHNSTLQHRHGPSSTQPLLMDSRHSFYRPSMTSHKQHKTLVDSGATIDESQGPVVVHASAKLEPSAHFIGPCLVEADAEVRHGAYVRPFSWICAGAVVGHNTEVKHSILLPGAKAPHFNYVGDSILGRDVNLGAGTKLSNLRNDGGEVHLRLDGSRHRQRPAQVRRGARRRVPAWVQQRYQSRNRSWATERRMAERDRDGAPS